MSVIYYDGIGANTNGEHRAFVLTGNYEDVYQYLRRLQALDTPLYWHTLLYEVNKFPLANVTLQVYTLSKYSDLIRN